MTTLTLETLSEDEIHVIWAALCAMTQDVHAPQDTLTPEQEDIADALYVQFNDWVDRRHGYK